MAKKLAFLPILIGLFLHTVVATSAQQYHLNLTAIYKTTNSAGALISAKMTAPVALTEIVGDGQLARTMALVFDVETGEVIVVQKTTGTVLGPWLQFDVDTTVANHDGAKSECYWNVTCPSDEGFAGTAAGTVQVVRGLENELTKFKMTGKINLRYRGENGGTRVLSGIFTTGARYTAPVSASR